MSKFIILTEICREYENINNHRKRCKEDKEDRKIQFKTFNKKRLQDISDISYCANQEIGKTIVNTIRDDNYFEVVESVEEIYELIKKEE